MITIEPVNKPGDHKSGSLVNLKYEEIEYVLGAPNVKDDVTKVKHSWGFTATMHTGVTYRCGIWSYKGSEEYDEWSFYGPALVMEALFGKHNIRSR
jgi:hypothetical protein